MLEETKEMYEAQASLIPNWKSMSKSELCNLYIENENDEHLRSCYFSAIILKYWNKIFSLHSKTYLTASYDDAYNWIVDSILYALKHRRWLDEDSKIYNDPNGPDKVINRRIKCTRINHLIGSNRYKRQVNINLLSLDSFEDADNFVGTYQNIGEQVIKSIVQDYWKAGDFVKAVIIDLIASGCCYQTDQETGEETFSTYIMSEYLINSFDNGYARYFSSAYEIDFDFVVRELDRIVLNEIGADLWGYGTYKVQKPIDDIQGIIKSNMDELSKDNNLRELLL